jgi:hypothetical protein
MAVKSKEALDEGDMNVGGDESWAITTNSTSFTDVRGRADGKLLLRMDAPPARGIVVRVSNVLQCSLVTVSNVLQRSIAFHIGIRTCKDNRTASVCNCSNTRYALAYIAQH